jgi:hypothetical protein
MKVVMTYLLLVVGLVFCQNSIVASEFKDRSVVTPVRRIGRFQDVKNFSNLYGSALAIRVIDPVSLLPDDALKINSPSVKEALNSVCSLRFCMDSATAEECLDQDLMRDFTQGYNLSQDRIHKMLRSRNFLQEPSTELIASAALSELQAIKTSLDQTIPGMTVDYYEKYVQESQCRETRNLLNDMNDFQQKHLIEGMEFDTLRRSYVDIKSRYVSLYYQFTPRSKNFFDKEMSAMDKIFESERRLQIAKRTEKRHKKIEDEPSLKKKKTGCNIF